MSESYDIAIIGQGLVGSTLAIAMAQRGYNVALVESNPAPPAHQEPDYDERSLALGYQSRQIFESLGLWQKIARDATPIERIHVSERGRLGCTRLNSSDFNICEMGYVATLRHLASVTNQQLSTYPNIARLQNQTLSEAKFAGDENTLRLTQSDTKHTTIRTQLLIGADGSHSRTRELLGVTQHQHHFQQSAVVANVTPQKEHQNIAFERFTPDGPIALLPLTDNRCALVWTQKPSSAETTNSLPDDQFLRALNDNFGYRLGRFIKTGRRNLFPLSMLLPERLTAQRSLLIGNAAHTLHPVAGQGLNLALRDIGVLLDTLDDNNELGTPAQLTAYETLRMRDITETARYTSTLVKLFSNRSPLLSHARAASLAFVDKLPPVKQRIAAIGMGRRSYLQSPTFHGLRGGKTS